MDANKLKVLREIDYKIAPHCGICRHSDLSSDGWGYCGLHKYEHLKHSEETSRLSINRTGSCSGFERDDTNIAILGLHGFEEFIGT
jgi:hypothetical protein